MIDLESIGYIPFFATQAELINDSTLVPARVAAEGRDRLPIIGSDAQWAQPSGRLRHAFEAGRAQRPAVGDWVLVSESNESDAVIHHVLDRRTCLKRRAAGSESCAQVIAANMDVFFIVTAVGQDFNLRRLERYLAVVWDSGASPVIVLNKTDLVASTEMQRLGEVAMATPVIPVSGQTGENVSALRSFLHGTETVAFIGSSGVGKSTLVNQLLGYSCLPTATLSANGKGRHTTVRRELVALPGGGVLIDTPGLRQLGLMEVEGLDRAFADIGELASLCHFADCTHSKEPGCAVMAAAATGEIAKERLASYLRLQAEARVTEAKSAASCRSKVKARTKAIRAAAKAFYKLSTKYR